MVARNRLVISGSLGTPAIERWSVGFAFGAGSGPLILGPADLNAWAQAAATALSLMPSNEYPRNELSTNARIERVDTYYYGSTGPAVSAGSYTIPAPVVGSGATAAPFQTARVLSLRTTVAGRSYRGRAYWPALGVTIGATGRASISQAGVNSYRTMLASLEAFGGSTDRLALAVYSAKLDTLTPVSTVAVGDVLDVQRRRRDALPEIYVSAAL